VNIAAYSWRSDLSEALASEGSVICQTVVHISRDGMSPVDQEVAIGGTSYNTADPEGEDCDATGRTTNPAVAPDDSVVAFTASAAAIGVSGPDRMDAPMSLMIKRGSSPDLIELTRGLRNPFGLRFAPSGGCLGFGAVIDGQGEGTFVIDPDVGRPQKISDQAIGAAWSPDGSFVAGALSDREGAAARDWLVVLPASCPPKS
jgi:hypothetical protein